MVTSNPVVANALNAVAKNTSGGSLFKCPKCSATGTPYDGFCRSCGYILPQDKMLKRADELITREIRKSTPSPIRGLAYIKGVGRIDLEIGKKGAFPGYDNGSGLSKIMVKHASELNDMAATLVLGKTCSTDDESKLARVRGDRFGILGKRPYGGHVITHYKDAKKAASFENRS